MMSLVNDPGATSSPLTPMCGISDSYVWDFFSLRSLPFFFAATLYLRHQAKGTCAPSYPVACSTMNLMRLLNTEMSKRE